jgi:hypothetical protein
VGCPGSTIRSHCSVARIGAADAPIGKRRALWFSLRREIQKNVCSQRKIKENKTFLDLDIAL